MRAIVGAGIPVMGHVGLTPQSATMLGGFKAQGRTAEKARQLVADALALEAAGCFALVLEAVPAAVAARITRDARRSRRSGSAPAPDCDGQVLVYHDLLGLYEGGAALRQAVRGPRRRRSSDALEAYAADVRSGAFPEEQHTYAMPEEELERLRGRLR